MNRSTPLSLNKGANLFASGQGRTLKLEHLPSGKVLAYCNVPAPASQRCSKQCVCALPEGHTTPYHRARCGARWKVRRIR